MVHGGIGADERDELGPAHQIFGAGGQDPRLLLLQGELRAIDIWIGAESDLGQGHGTQMMRLALARCFAAPEVTAVLLDPLFSNERARRFYERLGFRFIERRRFGADECAVYRLERAHWLKTE